MPDPLPLELDAGQMERLARRVSEFVCRHVATLGEQPASDVEGAALVAERLREPAPETGRPLEELLERLGPAIAKSYNSAGPGYLAYIPGGGIFTAALADFLSGAVNRYTGVREAAPALVALEETAIGWLAGAMGYPGEAGGVLTSGGSIANLAAIVTARSARLGDDPAQGTLYASEQVHHSVLKAARIAGFASEAVRALPVDDRFRLRPDALADAVRRDRQRGDRPFLVVASVGTVNTGAVDPLPELAAIARRERLWLHADAAYGGFFRLAGSGAALMPGIEQCDSITLDPHKGLFLPYGTGCLLVREARALRRAHTASAVDYLQDLGSGTGFADLSPELSRPFRGLRLWLPIQLHGLAAFRTQLEEKLELARWAHRQLAGEPALELYDEPQLTVVALSARAGDAAGAELLRRVNARRRVFLSSTRLRGRFALRLCVLSFRTHRDRVRDAVEALLEEARALA